MAGSEDTRVVHVDRTGYGEGVSAGNGEHFMPSKIESLLNKTVNGLGARIKRLDAQLEIPAPWHMVGIHIKTATNRGMHPPRVPSVNVE